jgi:hypothetical protein
LVGAAYLNTLDVDGNLKKIAAPTVMSDPLNQAMAQRQDIQSATIAVETSDLHKKTIDRL